MGAVFETTDLKAIRAAWLQVFETNDPFKWPFQAHFASGRLFYPTKGYHLTEPQYESIVSAAGALGEDRFFLSIVESEGLAFLDRKWGHWFCNRATYADYADLPLTLENALFSRNGRWGVVISHEMHAWISGSEKFLSALDREYSDWESDLRLLREAWLDNPNNSWLEAISRSQAQT